MNGFGFDRLSRDALIASLAFGFIGAVLWGAAVGLVLSVISLILAGLVLFRALSKDAEAREDELFGYERLIAGIAGFFSRIFKKQKGDKARTVKVKKASSEYRYLKCPECGKRLRVPKGKGRIRITCAACGSRFEKKV